MGLNLVSIKLELKHNERNGEVSVRRNIYEAKAYKMLRDEYGLAERLKKYNDDVMKLTEKLEEDIHETCIKMFDDITTE